MFGLGFGGGAGSLRMGLGPGSLSVIGLGGVVYGVSWTLGVQQSEGWLA